MEKHRKVINPICIVLAILLLASLVGNVLLARSVMGYESHRIIGTYCTTGNTPVVDDDSEYIAFFADGSYVRYKQSGETESGKYSLNNDRVYDLLNNKGGKTQIVYTAKTVYLMSNDVTCYEKISDTPTLLNAKSD